MFGRRRSTTHETGTRRYAARRAVNRVPLARGGVSLGAVMSGVLVAFGAMVVIGAAIAAVLAATHFRTDTMSRASTIQAAVAAVVVISAIQLAGYAWGGYVAGRMARGAGVLNGMLVPIVAAVLAAVAVGIGYGLDASTRMNVSLSTGRLNLSHARLVQLTTALAIASAAAMFVGAMIGGGLGSRWHTKLERRAATQESEPVVQSRTVDLRDTSERTRRSARSNVDVDERDIVRSDGGVTADPPIVKA